MINWLSIRRPSIKPVNVQPATGRWFLYLGLSLGIWLAMFLYVDTLSLPFFQDDVGHIRWLAQFNNPFTPLITATGVPAYRPLGEMLLKTWYMLLGQHDAAWLRFLNISMNSLNMALVAALAWRLDTGRWRYVTAGLAATLFGVFPFAYQAIPWINVFFYPLNSLLQLLMVLLYWEARTRKSNGLLVLALLLCALSPFEIEYGLMNSGLLLAVEIILLLRGRQKAIWLGGPLLGLIFNVGFLIIWFLVPKSAYQFGPPTPERMMQISTYLLQGFTYPASPLALPLTTKLGLNDLFAVTIIGLPVFILSLAVLLNRRKWSILVMSLSWYILINVPGLITLTFDYFINGPRLLYPVGPALAWFWAAFFTALVESGKERKGRFVLAGAAGLAVGIVVAMNMDFVRTRMEYYHVVEDPVHQLGAIARETPPDDKILVVNMPSWLTPAERTFALGNNGVQFMPFWVTVEDFIFAYNDRDHPTKAIQFHNIRESQPYFYGLHGQKVDWDGLREELVNAGDVYVTQYGADLIRLMPVGRVSDLLWNDQTPGARSFTFDDRLALKPVEYDIDGDSLDINLKWQIQEAMEDDVTIFVHLYGPDGQLVDQDDGYPLGGLSPFWLWESGQVIGDRRILTWPGEAPGGSYKVAVGVYDPASGERLPAADKDGHSLADNAAIIFHIDRP